ncbi:MAG: FAD:protein FMN transferase [Myxococcota bacterium]
MTPLPVLALLALAAVPPAPGADGGVRDADGGLAHGDDAAAALFTRRTRELMHTHVTVALPTDLPETAREAAFADAFAVFESIEERLNEWRPGSALSQVNNGAGGPAVPAPADVCEVVRVALAGAKRTDGLFDPTWAALRDVWRFGTDQTGEVPPVDELAKRCRLVNWRRVELRPLPSPSPERACTIRLPTKGMRLGLGGVVKGWGVDQAVSRLRARGLKHFFVQAGGDLYLAGSEGGRPWRAGVRDPRSPRDETFARVEVSDAAFSTSGDYEHFFVKDGVRYHHLIDPRTCRPATGSISATVLAKTAVDAEFLTKAVFILGPKKGARLAERLGASVIVVAPDETVHASKTLGARLNTWKNPR